MNTGINWAAVVRECKALAQEDDEGNPTGYCYLGTVMALTPSGKYYTPFAASGVTEDEAEADAAWCAELDRQAEQHGGYITSGEGDPCDVLFALPLDDDTP